MYRYIGNKSKLTPYILDRVEQLMEKQELLLTLWLEQELWH